MATPPAPVTIESAWNGLMKQLALKNSDKASTTRYVARGIHNLTKGK